MFFKRMLTIALFAVATAGCTDDWSTEEKQLIESLSLVSLEALPADPSNRYADDPRAAVLGKQLFFDTRLSANGKVSCGTCHVPEKQFQDDVALARGVGTTTRRTMPVAGTAYSPWLFWDGRKDSQWAQALGPLESPVEHGGRREQYVHVIAKHYRDEYTAIFGEDFRDTTRVFANIGKAIAAYERTLQFAPSRFDEYVAGKAELTKDELAGLKLFIGKANCIQCHNGPLLTDNHFHNTGVPPRADLPPDLGRALGAQLVLADEFNCRSQYSDAKPEDCAELEFLVAEGYELVRAYKTPSLRGVAERPPYMHAGQIETLSAVLEHYNQAPAAPQGHSELKPLRLSQKELAQLEAYLRAMNSAVVEKR